MSIALRSLLCVKIAQTEQAVGSPVVFSVNAQS
jgi:hypothetical protein